MQYLVVVYDRIGTLEKRLNAREAHLKGARELIAQGKIIHAGALTEGETMIGSTLYIDFETEDDIHKWLAEEPYVLEEVWNMDTFHLMPVNLLPKE